MWGTRTGIYVRFVKYLLHDTNVHAHAVCYTA